jgi:hypothetical protein
MFRKDGYNALPVASSSVGAAVGFEYLPFGSEYPERFFYNLKRLGRLYDPDIFIWSINSSNIRSHSNLKDSILSEIDIEISIPGYPKNAKEIQVSPVCMDGLKNTQQPGIFNLEDEECTMHVYKYVISLFDSEELV